MKLSIIQSAFLLAATVAGPLSAQTPVPDSLRSASGSMFLFGGSRIGYTGNSATDPSRQLRIANPADPSRDFQITSGSVSPLDFALAPDGHKVVYRTLTAPPSAPGQARDMSQSQMQYLLAEGNGQNPRVFANGVTLSSAAWSPDGRHITYSSRPGRRGVPTSIILLDSAGGNPRTIAEGLPSMEQATWSKTGVVAYPAMSATGTPVVMVADRDGLNPRTLTTAVSYQSAPGWSPDGSQLLFFGNDSAIAEPGSPRKLYVIDVDGSNMHLIRANATTMTGVKISPDRSQILFVDVRDKNTDLYVMNADGSNERRLTTDPGYDEGASWSPNGKEILFQSTRTGKTRVYLMNADGSNVRLIR